MKKPTFLFLSLLIGAVTPLASMEKPEAEAEPEAPAVEQAVVWQTLPRGVKFHDLHVGDGKKPALWSSIYVHYKLTAENGEVLEDTFRDHNRRAAKHVIGAGTMPELLEMAVGSMRERGKRSILIPAELLNPMDFHVHGDDEDEHAHDRDMERLAAALRPGSQIRAELTLLWVREYDPANFNRFR
jgi:hypothetical protein